jgi:dipeptidyl aminopeptidase/acylaminoacyl peptidase
LSCISILSFGILHQRVIVSISGLPGDGSSRSMWRRFRAPGTRDLVHANPRMQILPVGLPGQNHSYRTEGIVFLTRLHAACATCFLPSAPALLFTLFLSPDAAAQQRPLTALDLYQLRTAGDVALSPDGRRVVYVVTAIDSAGNRYRRDLWMAPTDGSEPPRRLTWSGGTGPVFSPDGTRIAFTAAREGPPQVWILPLSDGGEAWQLTTVDGGAGAPVWSPDGSRIAFTSALSPDEIAASVAGPTEPAAAASDATPDGDAIRRIHEDRDAALRAVRALLDANASRQDPRVVTRLDYLGETSIQDERWSQVHVIDVRPGARAEIPAPAPHHQRTPAWSPDGRSIILAAADPRGDYHPDYERESVLRVLDATSAGIVPASAVRDLPEPGYLVASPRYSPDGRHIVYTRRAVATPHPTAVNTELVVMRADGTGRESVTGPLDRSVTGWRITSDGWLYFTTASEGAVPLYRTRLDRLAPEPVLGGARGVLSFDAGGGVVAWSQMDPARPSDVHAARADGRDARRLTTLNDSLLAGVHVADYEELWYPSFDGMRIHGWYLRPLGYVEGGRYPLVVQIHGGPHAMWGPGEASMWLEYQMLAGAGYTVFFANPRGSGGYGEASLQSIHRNWGTPPARDILIGADSVIARGLADPERQVVTGGSYAGYMTAWLIAYEAPERFRAAVAARGVYDLAGWYGGSNTWRLFEGEFGTRPWEDPEITRAQSPLTWVENVRTPLLLLHADTDFRTTIATAEALYRALKVLGRDVEFVRYPREGHELTRSGEPAHRVDHMLRTLEYFERHVR